MLSNKEIKRLKKFMDNHRSNNSIPLGSTMMCRIMSTYDLPLYLDVESTICILTLVITYVLQDVLSYHYFNMKMVLPSRMS